MAKRSSVNIKKKLHLSLDMLTSANIRTIASLVFYWTHQKLLEQEMFQEYR